MPKSGWVISFHIKDAIAGATISGSRSAIESALLSQVERRSRSAMPSPSSSSTPTVEHRVEQRDPDRVPERAALEQLHILLEPDEAAQHRQVHVVALQRVPGGGAERHQDADADQQRRQRQQIGQRRAPEALLRRRRHRHAAPWSPCAATPAGREKMAGAPKGARPARLSRGRPASAARRCCRPACPGPRRPGPPWPPSAAASPPTRWSPPRTAAAA